MRILVEVLISSTNLVKIREKNEGTWMEGSAFIPEGLILLFAALDKLRQACELKYKRGVLDNEHMLKLIEEGSSLLMTKARVVNLSVALAELLKNDSVSKAMNLCLRRSNELSFEIEFYLNQETIHNDRINQLRVQRMECLRCMV